MIQKVFKGHQVRKEFRILKENLGFVKKVRGLLEKSYDEYRNSIINELVNTLKMTK